MSCKQTWKAYFSASGFAQQRMERLTNLGAALAKWIFDLKTSMEQLLQMKEEIKSKIKDGLTKFKSDLNSQALDMKNAVDFTSGKYNKVNNTAYLVLNKSEKLQQENLKLQTEIGNHYIFIISQLWLTSHPRSQSQLRNDSVIQGLRVRVSPSTETEKLRLVADEAEQHSRRNCLILIGVPEVQKEDTNDIVKDVAPKMAESSTWYSKLQITSIDRSNRLGKKTLHGKPCPITVKLCSYHDKEKMYQAKKSLKGTKMMTVESLTKRTLELLKRAKKAFRATNVWTLDGKTFTNKGVDADGNLSNQNSWRYLQSLSNWRSRRQLQFYLIVVFRFFFFNSTRSGALCTFAGAILPGLLNDRQQWLAALILLKMAAVTGSSHFVENGSTATAGYYIQFLKVFSFHTYSQALVSYVLIFNLPIVYVTPTASCFSKNFH